MAKGIHIFRSLITQLFGRRIFSDTLYLLLLQALNYLGSFVALPYLLRVLGPQAYGSVVFAQALVGYAVIFTEYGFGLTATRDIAAARGNENALAKVYWTTVAAKLLLLVCSAIILITIIVLAPKLRHDWVLFALCGTLIFGYFTFPQWYFQGIGQLRDATIAQVIARLALVAAILTLVNSPANMKMAAFLMSSSQLGGAVVLLAAGKRLYPNQFYRPKFSEVRHALTEAWHLFAGYTFTALYLQTNSFVLGVVSGKRPVAFYNLGYSIPLAIQALTIPVTLSIFPRVSILFSENRAAAWLMVKRLALFLLPAMGVASILLAFFADLIVTMVGGKSYSSSASILRVMAILPFMLTVATIAGSIVMVNIHLRRDLTRIYIGTGLLNAALLPYLVLHYAALGAAVSIAAAVTFSAAAMIWTLWRHRTLLQFT